MFNQPAMQRTITYALVLRAAIGTNDWDKIWKTAVMNAIITQ